MRKEHRVTITEQEMKKAIGEYLVRRRQPIKTTEFEISYYNGTQAVQVEPFSSIAITWEDGK
jgi:hypothetical protein